LPFKKQKKIIIINRGTENNYLHKITEDCNEAQYLPVTGKQCAQHCVETDDVKMETELPTL